MTPLKTALGIVFIVCLTIVIFTFITRGKLCELTIMGQKPRGAAKYPATAGNPLRAQPGSRPACRMLRS